MNLSENFVWKGIFPFVFHSLWKTFQFVWKKTVE